MLYVLLTPTAVFFVFFARGVSETVLYVLLTPTQLLFCYFLDFILHVEWSENVLKMFCSPKYLLFFSIFFLPRKKFASCRGKLTVAVGPPPLAINFFPMRLPA